MGMMASLESTNVRSRQTARPTHRIMRLVITLFLIVSSPVFAEWRLESYADKASEKTISIASVQAAKADRGVAAKLQIECVESRLVGGRQVSILLSAPLPQEDIGLGYRVDDRPAEQRILPVGRNSVTFIRDIKEIKNAKRLRVELFPHGISLFYDFSIDGVDSAIAGVPCR